MTRNLFRLLLPYLSVIFFGSPLSVNAQFNLETGYSYTFYQPKAINSLLTAYEAKRDNRSASLGSTKGFHGLEIAGIYHWESYSIGAFWSFKRDRNKIEYTASDGATSLTESVTFNNNLFGLMLQSNIEQFSIGTRIGYDLFTTKFEGNSEIPDRELNLDGGFVSQFFLSYTLRGGDLTRLMIRPFYQINWYEPDLIPLANMLEVPSIASDQAHFFGLSLIFVNGLAKGY